MARLPYNVDRFRDGAGYRYVAYSKDGFSCRLSNGSGAWDAYATLTGAYVGRRKTLALIGALVGSFTVKES